MISRAKLTDEPQGAWPRPIVAASRTTPANTLPARARLPPPRQTQAILKEVRPFGDSWRETPPHPRLQEPREETKRKSPVPSDYPGEGPAVSWPPTVTMAQPQLPRSQTVSGFPKGPFSKPVRSAVAEALGLIVLRSRPQVSED